MTDPLKLLLWVGLGSIVVGLSCLIAVAWANAGSQSLVLATSTLFAALILFGTQLLFELQGRSASDFVSTELTIDRETPQIRQWNYPPPAAAAGLGGWRLMGETNASAFLAKNDRARFDGDRGQLTNDMVLFSLVSYLAAQHFDWQVKRTRFEGPTSGTLSMLERVSKPEECTPITGSELQAMLRDAGNAFGAATILVMGGALCLPPNSTMTITSKEVIIATRHCTMKFLIEPSGSLMNMRPGTGGDVPLLATGQPRYETRLTGIRVLVEFPWIRAQSRERAKYEAWSNRIVDGARLWFEGATK